MSRIPPDKPTLCRPVGEADINCIKTIFVRVYPQASSHQTELLLSLISGPYCFGAIIFNDEVSCLSPVDTQPLALGFILCQHIQEKTAEIIDCAVLPEYQKKGLGRQLLDEVVSQARQRGIFTCVLEVREDNVNAHSLYSKAGFIPTGRRKHYYKTDNGRADAIVMHKELV